MHLRIPTMHSVILGTNMQNKEVLINKAKYGQGLDESQRASSLCSRLKTYGSLLQN